jgi:hypothetical protein
VIDEALIRGHFVPKLLGQSDERRAFDEREDAEKLWGWVLLAPTRNDAPLVPRSPAEKGDPWVASPVASMFAATTRPRYWRPLTRAFVLS